MPNADLLTQILALTGLLAVLIGAGYLLVRFVRKRYADSVDEQAFTLQDLREMKARGEITESEYQTMRAAIVGELSTPPRTPLPKPRPRTDDEPPDIPEC